MSHLCQRVSVEVVGTPDGAHVLFVSDRGGSRDIYRIPLEASGARAGEPERLATGLNVHSLSLSEDGKTLSYSVLTTKQNIWSIPIPMERWLPDELVFCAFSERP